MEIAVTYYSFPFAYMRVVDGIMEPYSVHSDPQWAMECDSTPNCKEGRILRSLLEDELRDYMKDEIIAGCIALVAVECPSAIGKKKVRIDAAK